jgi:hypothetical protein
MTKWTQFEGDLEPLKEFIGETVSISKTGTKTANGAKMFPPQFKQYGSLSVIDRGGGPAIYVQTLSEWYVTSWVVKVEKTADGFQFETENSLYEAKVR